MFKFWQYIKTLRIEKWIKLNQLASMLDITKAQLIRKEKGEYPFTLSEFLILLDVLWTTSDSLLSVYKQ